MGTFTKSTNLVNINSAKVARSGSVRAMPLCRWNLKEVEIALGELCTDSKELGYDMLWQGVPE